MWGLGVLRRVGHHGHSKHKGGGNGVDYGPMIDFFRDIGEAATKAQPRPRPKREPRPPRSAKTTPGKAIAEIKALGQKGDLAALRLYGIAGEFDVGPVPSRAPAGEFSRWPRSRSGKVGRRYDVFVAELRAMARVH